MVSRKGSFFVIEGVDGSGKNTQFKLLEERLRKQGYDVATFDFPQYHQPSSYFVREYLNGKYGSAEEVGPYTGSLFFSLDRYEAAPMIREALEAGKVVLANRFTGSNMAHQGTKFTHSEERRGYFIWLDNLEFVMLGMPRPDRSIVLRVPAEIAYEMVGKKQKRSYTDSKRDMHELDVEHLKKSVQVYDELCELFPKDFMRIDCVRGGKLMSTESVEEYLWKTVEPLLPPKPAKRQTAATEITNIATTISNPYITKTETGFKITSAGKAFLDECITSTSRNVYAFNDKLSPSAIAAAMVRLSRRVDNTRVTILEELAAATDRYGRLPKEADAHNDSSVQQLVGHYFVLEGASNLLSAKLEWGNHAVYLEQPARYVDFDQKDNSGNYKYYMPDQLDKSTKELYRNAMDRIFELYSAMVHKATEYVHNNSSAPKEERDAVWQEAVRVKALDALSPVLPVSAKSTVCIYTSRQELESSVTHLLRSELPEAVDTGNLLLREARKVLPAFLRHLDNPDSANSNKQVQKLANEYLSESHAAETNPVQLTTVWPRNELDLIPDMLYQHSSLSLSDITNQVTKWPISKKFEVFEAYIDEQLSRHHNPGRVLEKARYSWDLLCDYGVFRELQRLGMVEDLEWQMLTPRYGYHIPKLVEDAGLVDEFEACFDLSLKLHSLLVAAGYRQEAQYATLLGHKMRWKVTYSARQLSHLHELHPVAQSHPEYRKLVLEMYERLAEAHPTLGATMKLVAQTNFID